MTPLGWLFLLIALAVILAISIMEWYFEHRENEAERLRRLEKDNDAEIRRLSR